MCHYHVCNRNSYTFTPFSILKEWQCGTFSLALRIHDLQRFDSLKIENGHSSPLEVKNGCEEVFVEEFFTTPELNFTLFAAFLLFYIMSSTQYMCITCLSQVVRLHCAYLFVGTSITEFVTMNLILQFFIFILFTNKKNVIPSSWFLAPLFFPQLLILYNFFVFREVMTKSNDLYTYK